jgi:hypothetical protein
VLRGSGRQPTVCAPVELSCRRQTHTAPPPPSPHSLRRDAPTFVQIFKLTLFAEHFALNIRCLFRGPNHNLNRSQSQMSPLSVGRVAYCGMIFTALFVTSVLPKFESLFCVYHRVFYFALFHPRFPSQQFSSSSSAAFLKLFSIWDHFYQSECSTDRPTLVPFESKLVKILNYSV